MPRVGAALAERVLLPELGVVLDDFAGELIDHGLPGRDVLAAGQLGHSLRQRGDHLVGIDRVRLVGGDGIFRKEIVDHLDNQAMQARPFIVVVWIVCHGCPFGRLFGGPFRFLFM